MHRGYVDAGCDVLSTDTWSILSAPERELRQGPGGGATAHWMDVARLGIRLARRAVEEGDRVDDCAVAFAISEEVNSSQRRGTLELLGSVFAEEPPDLILLETLTLVRDPEIFETVRVAPRDRASGLALVPALPPRRLRGVRSALGPSRRRSLRAGGAAVRGDGRRCAARSTACRSTTCPG